MSRPATYPYPPANFEDLHSVRRYTADLYRSLVENDSRGDYLRDRRTPPDLRDLMVRPEWYGAKGDGTTDDTIAIQAAIDAAEATGTADGLGGTVVFSNKKYITTSALTVDDDYVSLMGIGGGSIIKNTGTGAAITLSSADHVKIKNLSIWGDGGAYGAGASGTYGVELNGSTHVVFDTVDIRYHGSHAVYAHGGVWVVSFVNCKIQQNAGDGANFISPSGAEQNGNNISFVNCAVFNNALNGINWKGANLNVVGTALETNYLAGINVDCTGSTLSAYGINISGSYFESNRVGQINLVSITGYVVFGGQISGNYFYSNYAGVDGATALITASRGSSYMQLIRFGHNSYDISGAVLTHWVDLGDAPNASCNIARMNNDSMFTNLGSATLDIVGNVFQSDADGQILLNYGSGADGTYSLVVYDGSTNQLFGVDRLGGLSCGRAGDDFTMTIVSNAGAGKGSRIVSYRGGANAWEIGDSGYILGGDTSNLCLYGFGTNDILLYARTALTATVNNAGINLASGKVLQVNGTQVVGAQAAAEADAKADYTTGCLDTEAEVITAINATNTKINNLLAKLRTHGIIAT